MNNMAEKNKNVEALSGIISSPKDRFIKIVNKNLNTLTFIDCKKISYLSMFVEGKDIYFDFDKVVVNMGEMDIVVANVLLTDINMFMTLEQPKIGFNKNNECYYYTITLDNNDILDFPQEDSEEEN
jgi:hypothetical protein